MVEAWISGGLRRTTLLRTTSRSRETALYLFSMRGTGRLNLKISRPHFVKLCEVLWSPRHGAYKSQPLFIRLNIDSLFTTYASPTIAVTDVVGSF
jgi:hypothetical protein